MEMDGGALSPRPALCQTPGQLLSRQSGHTARHPDPSTRAHWLPLLLRRFSLTFTITPHDINNSGVLAHICLSASIHRKLAVTFFSLENNNNKKQKQNRKDLYPNLSASSIGSGGSWNSSYYNKNHFASASARVGFFLL